MKDNITTIIEIAGAVLMTYGIWQFDERVAMIFLGSLMILGSYFYSRRI